MGMTAQRRAFAEYYLQCWNATKAAKQAGYSPRTAYSQGPRLLKIVEVQEFIAERMKDLQMQADEAMIHLTRIARSPQADAMTSAGPNMRLVAEKYGDMVKKYSRNGNGGVTVEFYNKLDALKTILQVHEKIPQQKIGIEIEGFEQMLEKVYGDVEASDNDAA